MGFQAFTAAARVQSLVKELRSHKLWGAAQKMVWISRVIKEVQSIALWEQRTSPRK